MIHIQPLSTYKFNLKAKKLEGLARLARLNIPTVANLFIVLPNLFDEFQKLNTLPLNAVNEMRSIFYSIKQQGDNVTLRNSIFEEGNPALSFAVSNSLNLKDFNEFLKRIILGYKKVLRLTINSRVVEFCYLIQSFYSSEKCGVLLSDNGQGEIFLQAILGQHTKLLLRGDLIPDEYLINKKTYKIIAKTIAVKQFRIKKLRSGITKIRVKKNIQEKPVLTDRQVISIAKLSQTIEKTFGPQEIEWAVLDSGKIIFQETRDFKQSKKIKFFAKAEIIYPAEVTGRIINLNKIPKRKLLSDKIILTNNLNIGFINKLAFLYRPKAIILTRGSLTCHAATILREARITTVLTKKIVLEDGQKIKISKDGRIHKI